jgi:DNA-binding YbaB/EbfC family protein
MFNFKDLGSIFELMRNAGKIREEAEKFHARLAEVQTEASAGGDMVTAKVNGKMELLKLTISPEAFSQGDREMLEDLIAAAVNQAITKVRGLVQVEAQAMAQNMGLPPGMDIPGLG